MLRILAGPEPVPLAEIRETLEAEGLIEPSDGARRAAIDRTLRNHLAHLRDGCANVLGDRHRWIQGSGEEVGLEGAGKGPFYRLRLKDAVPLVDASGTVRDGTEADALDLAASLISAPGGGPFENALARVRVVLFPDGTGSDGVGAQPLDTATRSPVLAEVLRVLHRNGSQAPSRSRHRRWLRLQGASAERIVWPVLLHPAWVPPCPGWRLLCWDAEGWHDVLLGAVDHAQAGPMVFEQGVALPARLIVDAGCLHDAAFCGSCPGPLAEVVIEVPTHRTDLARMRWGAGQSVLPTEQGRTRIRCTTSDLVSLVAWARAAGVNPSPVG